MSQSKPIKINVAHLKIYVFKIMSFFTLVDRPQLDGYNLRSLEYANSINVVIKILHLCFYLANNPINCVKNVPKQHDLTNQQLGK